MNYLEFKRQLMVDPYDTSEDFEALRNSDKKFVQAAAESDRFEALLQQAFNVPVPADLIPADLTSRAQTNAQATASGSTASKPAASGRHWMVAMAAGLVMGVGLTVGGYVYLNQPPDIGHYLASHWQMDAEDAQQTAAAEPMQPQQIRQMLATMHLQADQELVDRIRLVKYCDTPGGMGVHLLVEQADGGMLTVYYMPRTGVRGGRQHLQINDHDTMVLATQRGAIAMISDTRVNPADMEQLSAQLHEGERWAI